MPLIRTGLSAESKTLNIVPPFPLIMVRLVPAPTRVIEFVRLKVEFQTVLPAVPTNHVKFVPPPQEIVGVRKVKRKIQTRPPRRKTARVPIGRFGDGRR